MLTERADLVDFDIIRCKFRRGSFNEDTRGVREMKVGKKEVSLRSRPGLVLC